MNPTWLYVLAVYAVAIALARRAGAGIPWRVAACLYVLVFAWMFAPLTGQYVNLASDVTKLIPPWSANAPASLGRTTVSNYELQDPVFQIAPWAHQVRESWLSMRVPLWNGQSGCGLPLLANMQSEALAPLRLLVLPLPLAFLTTAEAALKILAALTFMFLFCRRHFDVLPSLAGAIAFGFGGWSIVWLQFPIGSVGAFLPALLYQIDVVAERVTIGRFAFLAAIGAAIVASGHPATAGHMAMYAVMYAAWLAATSVRARQGVVRLIGTLAAAAVVTALLAAPVLAPFLETVRKSVRYQDASSRADVGTPFSDFPSLIPAIQPRYFGEKPGPAWGPAQAETLDAFAGLLGIAAWFGLLFRAAIRRRFAEIETFLLLCAVVIVGLVEDWPVIGPPFLALFAVANNHRVRLMLCFLAAAMTAALVHHARRERSTLIAAIFGGIAAVAFLFWKTAPPDAAARHFALVATIPSAIALASLLLLLMRRRFAPIAVALAVFAELWVSLHHYNPVRPREELFPRTPLIEALLKARTDQPYRIAGIGAPLFPNTHAPFGFEDARVHDPMANARYAGVLRATMKDYDVGEYYPKFKDPDAPVLDFLNVRWLLTERGVDVDHSRYALMYDGPDGRVWENRNVLPRFFAARNVLLVPSFDALREHRDWHSTALVRTLPHDAAIGHDLLAPRAASAPETVVTIREASNDAYTLHVSAPRHTLVASSVTYWPGWRVTHDGHTLEPQLVNGAFLGFIVPPGEGTVRVRYVPLSFWGGLAVSLLTAAALAVAVAVTLSRERTAHLSSRA